MTERVKIPKKMQERFERINLEEDAAITVMNAAIKTARAKVLEAKEKKRVFWLEVGAMLRVSIDELAAKGRMVKLDYDQAGVAYAFVPDEGQAGGTEQNGPGSGG